MNCHRYNIKEIHWNMPAIDQCEAEVIRALQKSGWRVTHQPFAIKIERSRAGYIYADLRLQRESDSANIIVVEVKCFDSSRTLLEEFYHAVGQYLVYRNALQANQINVSVYLTVPIAVYKEFFLQPLIQSVVKDIHLNVIVIDLDHEEVSQWIISNQ